MSVLLRADPRDVHDSVKELILYSSLNNGTRSTTKRRQMSWKKRSLYNERWKEDRKVRGLNMKRRDVQRSRNLGRSNRRDVIKEQRSYRCRKLGHISKDCPSRGSVAKQRQ
ncbi:zinc knuckle [Cooperia oncophora]